MLMHTGTNIPVILDANLKNWASDINFYHIQHFHFQYLPYFKFADINISKHGAKNNISVLLVCVCPGGGGVVISCRELPKQFLFNMVYAAPSFCIWISFNGVERDSQMKKTTLLLKFL